MLRLPILSVFLFVMSSWAFGAQDPNKNGPAQFDVGVILDLNTLIGKMAQTSIAMAVEDFYEVHSNYSTRLVLDTRDGNQDDGLATLEGD
ncbi:Glutamate receptor [Rhynchospora pubera]|uniref:Glutamate receptor n=1 Tax=Rhynchospora pubera TaxID=906938 RepID=A0AAV8BSI9_9POAL|nr:Glutamate receptor [Rhynchospora pubera]